MNAFWMNGFDAKVIGMRHKEAMRVEQCMITTMNNSNPHMSDETCSPR